MDILIIVQEPCDTSSSSGGLLKPDLNLDLAPSDGSCYACSSCGTQFSSMIAQLELAPMQIYMICQNQESRT